MNSLPEDHADSEVQTIENQEPVVLELQGFVQESNDEDSAGSEAESESATPDVTMFSEYEFVADLLRRQDEVLDGLDDLNERIESAIKEISATRQAEIDAAQAAEQSENDSESLQGDPAVEDDVDQAVVSKAA